MASIASCPQNMYLDLPFKYIQLRNEWIKINQHINHLKVLSTPVGNRIRFPTVQDVAQHFANSSISHGAYHNPE